MYLILAKKEKGDSFSSIFVLINWYLRNLGKRDYILAYPGYTSIWGKTPSKSSHLRDNLFVIPGNDNHGLITHMMNTSQCSAMDQAVNNPQKRYSFLDHLYRKKPDHSKMLVFFDDEDGTTKKYFDCFLNCACSWKIPVPNWKAKALVLGSSNMSDTTYMPDFSSKKKANKGEADIFMCDESLLAGLGNTDEERLTRLIHNAVNTYRESSDSSERNMDRTNYDSMLSRFTASRSIDIRNGNDTLSGLLRNFVVCK